MVGTLGALAGSSMSTTTRLETSPVNTPTPAAGSRSNQSHTSVAVAGVSLGVLGLLISVGMFFDLFVALPSAAGG